MGCNWQAAAVQQVFAGSLFSTTFKKLAGISPLTYRKQYK
ncbi:Protein of unknown function [Lactobacillus equicursoris 66c]|uniref:HTH araC/xylS-type domain-containing protein n=1 Tax=Lactobacillus equicursoris 66c TaxID=872326 RepID=K0NNM8_9LACO|nr:Protein of unknown function [Lactobacillus equicursoris 66c]